MLASRATMAAASSAICGVATPALEQRLVHRLFIGERQTGRRRCQQRRASTGNQAQYEIVGREPDNLLADSSRCLDAGSVGHRMRGVDGGIEHASQQLTRCAHWISRKRGLIIDKAPAV